MVYLHALERKDFNTVRSYISDDISVVSPGPEEIISYNKAEPFMSYLKHANNLRPLEISAVLNRKD